MLVQLQSLWVSLAPKKRKKKIEDLKPQTKAAEKYLQDTKSAG